MSEPDSIGIYWKIFPVDSLFVLRYGVKLIFHTLDGEPLGEISMRDSIADYYCARGKTIVYTASFIYEFIARILPGGKKNLLSASNTEK